MDKFAFYITEDTLYRTAILNDGVAVFPEGSEPQLFVYEIRDLELINIEVLTESEFDKKYPNREDIFML